MSRFFARGSDSESSSSEEEELYGTSSEEELSSSQEESEEEEDEDDEQDDDEDAEENSDSDSDEDKGAKGPGFYKRNAFLKGAAGSDSSDEESEDDRRIVKSAKDKLLDEIDSSMKQTENAKKINDWIAISDNFDKTNKLVDRAQKQYSTVPKKYIKWLVDLDEFAQETTKSEKETKKKMNKSNSQSFNSVKQRLKKTMREHETSISAYKTDAEAFLSEKPASTSSKPQPASTSTSSVAASDPTATAAADDDDGFSTVGKGGKVAQYTVDNLMQTLIGVAESRGKKNVDRVDQLRILGELLKIAVSPYHLISILLLTVSVRFDATAGGQVLATEEWKAAEKDIRALFDVLEENSKEYRVSAAAAEPEDFEVGPAPGPDGVRVISGSVSSLVERLDDELTKALQTIDFHTTEYVDRLRDEADLYYLILRAQIYLEAEIRAVQGLKSNESDPLSRLLVRRLEHIYYKPTSVIITGEKNAWSQLPEATRKQGSFITPETAVETGKEKEFTINLVSSICQALYQQQNTTFRTKAMLSHIYHYALNDLYFQARDMFLMSHLQSSIHTAEPSVQVLFNRALVQVGLCAFKLGLISECQQSLAEICSSAKLKELLGQGVAKYAQGSHHQQQQQQAADRQRLLPFHMHINLELLECVYLTSSLLIEVPLMGATISSNQSLSAAEAKKRIISKPFRRYLEQHDRQVFTGPPENNRDHIMQAASTLLSGDWAVARDLLTSIKIWSLLPNADNIRSMLSQKVQEEGLRTYLFMYGSSCYASLSLKTLANLFDMPASRTSAIVSKLIANEEISAALDQTNDTIVFRQGVQLSKLQSLALSLSEKAVQLAERNERLAAGGYQLEPNTDSQQSQQQQGSGNTSGNNQQTNNHRKDRDNNNNRRPQQNRPQQRGIRT